MLVGLDSLLSELIDNIQLREEWGIFMLRGKNAVVTGSTSGIGLGIAKELAAQGANVLLNGFGEANEIERLRNDLATTYGARLLYHSADLSKTSQIEDLAQYALAELGTVDILVNNAGIQHTAPVESFPAEKWDLILAVNLSSAFHLMRLFLPAMKAKGWGRIINIASVHGLVASVHKAGYVAAKHGLVGLTKVVALECADTAITCNAICPGWVLTPLVQKQIDALAAERSLSPEEASRLLLEEKQPSKRFTGIQDLAALVSFLCSDAAGNMNGASLPVDGGWIAR